MNSIRRSITPFLGLTLLLAVLALDASKATALPPSDSAPLKELGGTETGLDSPMGVAFDSRGLMYVANAGNDSVTVYAAKWDSLQERPMKTLAGPSTQLANPTAIAFDDSGLMYVANSASVSVYPADWAAGNTAPIRVLSGPSTGLLDPRDIAFDSAGRMYVVNSYQSQTYGGTERAGSVTVYAPQWPSGDSGPVATLQGPATTLDRPTSLAFDGAGRLLVTDRSSVKVFDATWTPGSTAPLLTVSGGASQLAGPGGIAVDRIGLAYVANEDGNRVTVFSGFSLTTDTQPYAVLSGFVTRLAAPVDVAFDGNNRLVVVNRAASSITVYDTRLQVISLVWSDGRPLLSSVAVQFGQPNLDVVGTATSGLPVTMETVTPNVCRGSGIKQFTLDIVGVGLCSIAVRQAGNLVWAPAPPYTTSFYVYPGNQSLRWAPLVDAPLSVGSIQLSASSTSGMPVVWTSQTPTVCTTVGAFGRQLVFKRIGLCTVLAEQKGNSLWYSIQASQTMQVMPDGPSPAEAKLNATCTGSESNQRRSIRCVGSSEGIDAGVRLKVFRRQGPQAPWVALPTARGPLIAADGTFVWSNGVRSTGIVQIYFSFGSLASDPSTVEFRSTRGDT